MLRATISVSRRRHPGCASTQREETTRGRAPNERTTSLQSVWSPKREEKIDQQLASSLGLLLGKARRLDPGLRSFVDMPDK